MRSTPALPAKSRPLPDIVAPNLDVLIVAINPSLRSAAAGYSFASKGNPFWRLLHESGLTKVLLRPEEGARLTDFGVGLASGVRRHSNCRGAHARRTAARRQAGGSHRRDPTTPLRRAARAHALPHLLPHRHRARTGTQNRHGVRFTSVRLAQPERTQPRLPRVPEEADLVP